MAHWNCNVPPPGFGLWNVPPPSLPPLPPLPPQPPQPPQPREDQTAPPSASMLGLNAAQLEWIRRCRQRVPDQQFLDGFLASRIRPEPLPPPATVKIGEFRKMAAEARQLLGRLEATRLQPEKAWTVPEISALQPVRDRLNWIMDQLGDGALLGELKEKLRKRKARRQWMRRKKDANEKDLQEMLIRRRRLHEDIDRDRELAQSKLLIEKRDRETQCEADRVLSEVRRKRSEAERLLHLLDSLKELRRLRAAQVQARDVEADERFERVTTRGVQLMTERLVVYEKEELTLRAMIQVHEPEKHVPTIAEQWDMYARHQQH